MIKSFRITVPILLFLLSCTDNPVDNNNDNSFSVEVEVVDSIGNSLPNIQVSIWSKIENQANLNKLVSFKNINATTTIQFQIVERCYVDLTLYDLNNVATSKLVSGQYNAGMYAVAWSTLIKNGVYKATLITSSDSLQNSFLFKDSIYIALISPDPNESLVGSTDNNGKMKVVDKLLFPHLFNLPLIPRTFEGGPEIFGYFSYSDSVVIALSDISFTKTVLFNRLVVDGKNHFRLKLGSDFLKFEKDNSKEEIQLHSSLTRSSNFFSADGVVFTSFTSTISDQDVILNWTTSGELNNQGFEIERSTPGNQNWVTIGFVVGSGTTNEVRSYSFRDANLLPATYRYRLKQIDFDGSFSYSNEIVVEFGFPLEWELFQNYPNPFN
jgi:hypothetical protein